jgi:hypothetical protein
VAGEVEGAREEPAVAYFGGGELGTCGEETVGGGDSRGSGSIPSTGSKKAARQSFGAPRRKSGRRGTAAGIDG